LEKGYLYVKGLEKARIGTNVIFTRRIDGVLAIRLHLFHLHGFLLPAQGPDLLPKGFVLLKKG
jgi:hypothetical protein